MTRFEQVWEEAKRQKEINRLNAIASAKRLDSRREQEIAESVLLNSLGLPRKGNYVNRTSQDPTSSR